MNYIPGPVSSAVTCSATSLYFHSQQKKKHWIIIQRRGSLLINGFDTSPSMQREWWQAIRDHSTRVIPRYVYSDIKYKRNFVFFVIPTWWWRTSVRPVELRWFLQDYSSTFSLIIFHSLYNNRNFYGKIGLYGLKTRESNRCARIYIYNRRWHIAVT